MSHFFTWKIIAMAATFIVGPLTYLAVKHIKEFWVWLDRQPAMFQRVIVLVVAFALTAGLQVAGLALPGECADAGNGLLTDSCKSALADPVFVKAILSAGIAMLLHKMKQSEPNV